MNCGGRIYVFLAVLQGEVDFAGGFSWTVQIPKLSGMDQSTLRADRDAY